MSETKREIGKSGIFVSPVAMGCWPISGMTSLNVNDDDSRATVRAAIDSGINFLDSAFCYGADGKSEQLIGEVIADCRDDVVIATKGGIHWDSDIVRHNDASPDRIVKECEISLQRMNIETIDLYYLHSPDPNVPVEESATAFVKLLESGKIRSVGASNFKLDELKRFNEVCPISAVQNRYNMLQRGLEDEVIPWCLENNVSVMNYWPLMKGLLAGKIRRDFKFDPNDKRLSYEVFQGENFERAQLLLDKLDLIASKHDKTVAQVVVNWCMHRPGITSVLCGAKRPWQIEDTAGAMGWSLDEEQLKELSSVI
ncbi:aldo/keto reductase [Mariniblastus fucicola]|nr:aldo/keto reductase [Mariniblastus fucicola]